MDGIPGVAVLYLTPDAPVSSGTGIYMYEDGTRYSTEVTNKNKELIGRDSQDLTKWTLVDRIEIFLTDLLFLMLNNIIVV